MSIYDLQVHCGKGFLMICFCLSAHLSAKMLQSQVIMEHHILFEWNMFVSVLFELKVITG